MSYRPAELPPVVNVDGVHRFRANRIVRHLLDQASERKKCDMNDLSLLAQNENLVSDWEEFLALIGYSVCGFLNYDLRPATRKQAYAREKALLRKRRQR